jgi:iron complex transport system ATP-binding protein
VSAVRVENLTFAYDGRPVLQGITLDVRAGEFLALIGPNGSGKTTLLRAISGVLPVTAGAVYVQVVDRGAHLVSELSAQELARSLAAVEQETYVAFDFTVREIVALGRLPHLNKLQAFSASDQRRVDEVMQRVGITQFAERSVQSLSSGERQRVFIAMALAQEPKVLLLDEPTAHLDLRYQLEIMELVRGLVDRGLAVIAAVHDLNLAARYSDRVAVLSQGRVVNCGPPQEMLTSELIEEVWGVKVELVHGPDGHVGYLSVPKLNSRFVNTSSASPSDGGCSTLRAANS